jgi:hypothetical protein
MMARTVAAAIGAAAVAGAAGLLLMGATAAAGGRWAGGESCCCCGGAAFRSEGGLVQPGFLAGWLTVCGMYVAVPSSLTSGACVGGCVGC